MASATRVDEEKMFEGQPKGFPFGEFELEDVMLPENDDMGIVTEDDEDSGEEVDQETGFGSVVAIIGLPKVPEEKYEKLTTMLMRLTSKLGEVREDGLTHPKDEATGVSKGWCFVEYETPEEARLAVSKLDGFQLDKAHRIEAALYDECERLAAVPDEYQPAPPKPSPWSTALWDWLGDTRGRDQFVMRYGDESEVDWNDVAHQQPEKVYERSFWTDSYLFWTPNGGALTTMHRQGVALWGGPNFERLTRLSHADVVRAAFSPDERFAYTFSEQTHGKELAFLLHVWDIRTGRKLRTFSGPQAEFAVGVAARPDGGMAWDAFRWSGSRGGPAELEGEPPRSYLAHLRRGAISVYESPEFGLIDKKSYRIDSVQLFEWSPSEPVLAAYVSEEGNMPARVQLVSFPTKTELRAKNLFSVAGVTLTWHPQGDYLAVQVDKWTKSHKSTTTNFELFSLREKDTPIDILELPNNREKVFELTWEPRGHRFAVLHGDNNRLNVSIFTMKGSTSSRGVTSLQTMTNKQVSSVHWSPVGRFFVLAGLKGHNGALEFWDADENALLSTGEHFMAGSLDWDPTGRYVVTMVDASNNMDNGFNVWSFSGQLLYKVDRERLFQFAWRPRPPMLISEEKQKEIQRNLKRYSKRYDEEDERLLLSADAEFLAEREREMNNWREWLESRKEWIEQERKDIEALLGPEKLARMNDYEVVKAEVSVVVDSKEEVIKQ